MRRALLAVMRDAGTFAMRATVRTPGSEASLRATASFPANRTVTTTTAGSGTRHRFSNATTGYRERVDLGETVRVVWTGNGRSRVLATYTVRE